MRTQRLTFKVTLLSASDYRVVFDAVKEDISTAPDGLLERLVDERLATPRLAYHSPEKLDPLNIENRDIMLHYLASAELAKRRNNAH